MATTVSDPDYKFDLGITSENYLHILQPSCCASCIDKSSLQQHHLWFQRGLVWYYAFNHEEAIICFDEALKINSDCPLAHYGISLCHGPNYNTRYMSKDEFPSAVLAYRFAVKANELILIDSIRQNLSQMEIDLIEALACRYNPIDPQTTEVEFDHNNNEYIAALEVVYKNYPTHPCAASMFAEALMNTNPWKLWDLSTGIPTPAAQRAQQILELSLAEHPNHPGLNHFNIHLLEMSPTPEAALKSCETLRYQCAPDAGHLIHMPSHIYVLLGMYDDATQSNIEAIKADEKYHIKAGNLNCYTGYRIHNIHFVSYAAMFAGQFQLAYSYAQMIHDNITTEVLQCAFLAKYFESFVSIDLHVLIRFGKWDDLLRYPIPQDTQLYPFTLCTLFYGRGIAYAVLGDVVKAKEEQRLFRNQIPLVPGDFVRHNNLCSDLNQIAEAMLQGEILYREGAYDAAFESLKEAVDLSDNLVYDEPWGWMQPPCHALGGLLLEQGRHEEAEYYFRRDMDRSFIGRCHPDNLWALCGLAGCLKMKLKKLEEGSGAEEERGRISKELTEVSEKIAVLRTKSDVEVKVSCLCVQSS